MKPRDTTSQMDRYEAAIVLVRLLVGWVFLSEGIQKFLYPAALAVGRFAKIGIPAPQVMAPFVGGVEIVFGALILLGLFTRLATIPLLITITVAILTTKVPFLVKHGFWAALHESRADISMLLGLIFLLIVGAGSISLDARFRPGTAMPSSR
ncbi:MAG: DoxX family protein [Acidobacteriaceae bacterium]